MRLVRCALPAAADGPDLYVVRHSAIIETWNGGYQFDVNIANCVAGAWAAGFACVLAACACSPADVIVVPLLTVQPRGRVRLHVQPVLGQRAPSRFFKASSCHTTVLLCSPATTSSFSDAHRCLPVRADAVSKIQAGLQGVNFGMLWFDVGESCLSASKAASSPSWFRVPLQSSATAAGTPRTAPTSS